MLGLLIFKLRILNEFKDSMIRSGSGIFIAFLLLFLLNSFFSMAQPVYASHGTLDARSWNFPERLALNGYWNFYPMQLLSPQACRSAKNPRNTYFPGLWNDISLSGTGFATYSLLILVPSSIDTFSLEIPPVYCSYELWINNQKVAANGKVGRTKSETVPQWLPKVATVKNSTDTLHVVLQISNFQHHRGGAKDPVYLGVPREMLKRHSMSIASNLINILFVFVLGSVFLILFLRHSQQVILYFSLLCISWSMRSLFSTPYSIIYLFPDFNWLLATKIEYITLFLVNIFGLMFLNRLFSYSGNKGAGYFLVVAHCIFTLITIFFSSLIFTRWLPLYLIFSTGTLIFAVVIIIWAIIHDQQEAWLMVISLLLGIVTFSYDLISYQGALPYNAMALNAGYLLIFILMAIALLLRLGFVKSEKKGPVTILKYEDLFREQP